MSRRDPPAPLPDTDDPYVLLDVRPGASSDQIRRAYLRRVKVYKPDRHPAEFRRVREAYDRLREQEAWFDAWRQAKEVVREAIENAASDQGEGDDEPSASEGPGDAVVEDETAAEHAARIDAATSEWARIEAAQRQADAEIEAEVEREAEAELRRGGGGWDGEPVPIGEHRATDEPDDDDGRPRSEHVYSVDLRVADLASMVHDELERGHGEAAIALLLDPRSELLASRPAFATLLLEVCCVAVWTEPERYDELVARYGDLIAEHDVEHRDGALLHRRTVADERPAWDQATHEWPELQRFVELGSSLRAPAEAQLGLHLGQRAAADSAGFLRVLNESARAAPGVAMLFVSMAERWDRHYGRPLPGTRPAADTPSVDEAAEALAATVRGDRHVRWLQLRPLLSVAALVVLMVLARSTLSEVLVLAAFIVQWAWRAWRGSPLERLYLRVVQPAAARWLWVTGASPEALAEAVHERLPAAGSLGALLHPVDIHGHAKLIANDLALQAFAVTRPMVPRLGKRPPR